MKYQIASAVLLVMLSPLTACAHQPITNRAAQSVPSHPDCSISPAEREALLNLGYKSFDQTLPDGGWRKYQNCPTITKELIDQYVERHKQTLQKQEWDVLVWHSGQLAAMAGDYKDAISKMEQTFKPNEKPTDAFLWNPYAAGSIAFLRHDKKALNVERKKLAKGTSPYNHINLRKIDAFIRCFDSSYEVAYSGNCTPAETNQDRIRSLAVKFDANKTLPFGLLGLGDFFKDKKVVSIGEIHGTKTVPELFGKIVESVADDKSKTLVALEISETSQGSIDAFLRTGDESILRKDSFFSRSYQDGRSSRAMVALLRKLSKLPNVTVLCMDVLVPNPSDKMSGQERDSAMAQFINKHRVDFDRTVVLSGNVHSRTEIGTPWDATYRPMGYELKSLATDLSADKILSVLVRYEKVDSWNCQGAGPDSCQPRYGRPVPTDYSKAVSWSSYFLWEDKPADGHSASLFVRRADISMPFVYPHGTATH